MVAWSLSKKFFALNIGMSLVTVAVAVMSFVGGGETQQKYEAVARGVLDDVISIDQAFLDFRETRIGLRTLGISGVTPEQGEAAKQQVQISISSVDSQLEKLDRPELSGEQKKLVSNLKSSWAAFKKTGVQIFALYDSGTPESRVRLVGIFFKECPEAAADFLSHAEKLRHLLASQQKAWVVDARQTAEFNNLILGIISFIGIILGLLLSTMITIRISNSLKKLITELNGGARQVADAATQIANTSSTLSRSAANQAGSLEESVASVEELTATVKFNTDNAKQASVLANSARDLATMGEAEMKSLIEVIQRISSDSKQIADISSVIDDIAFQTNLLALNAAVEAARAGEQGKGFAVVADAVRSLAQRSAESAKSINSLIEDSVGRIDKSAKQANQSGEVLNEIVNSIKKVSDLNQEIATASEEQSVGITQISRAMNQLDVVTQENAAASQDSAATAEELSAQSSMLLKNVTALDNLASGG